MISFERRYDLNRIGKVLKIGDYTRGKCGTRLIVTNIVSIEFEEDHLIVKGYGMKEDY